MGFFSNSIDEEQKFKIEGYQFLKQGQYLEALDMINKALILNPNDAIAWNNKGSALDSLGQYLEAIRAFDRTIELDPNYATGWNNKGWALYNLGQYQESIRALDKALLLNPEFEESKRLKQKIIDENNENKHNFSNVGKKQYTNPDYQGQDPIQILKTRLARGEISKEEFLDMRRLLK